MNANRASFIVVAALLVAGCGDDEPSPLPVESCAADHTLGTECVGSPTAALCGGATCTDGVECASVIEVASDAELQAALPGAQPGTCIALRDGNYGAVLIPPGVSVLGRGPANARVGAVQIQGTGTTLKGVNASGGGVRLGAGAIGVRVDAVRVENSGGDGLQVEAGASAEVTRSEIVGSARYGVSAFGSAGISLSNTVISGSKGPGVWAECPGGCECAEQAVPVSIINSIIRDNKIVGVSLVGAQATFLNVEIRDQGVTETTFAGGAGLSVSGCSALDAKSTKVLDNTDFGVLIDDSSATIGGSGNDEAMEVSRNQIGLWMQNIGQSGNHSIEISGCRILQNSAVGLGLDGESRGIIIYGTEVRDTSVEVIPVLVGGVSAGAKEVGDGLNWLGLSQASIDGLLVSGSARQSILIDGEVGANSSIANVLLENGDDAKGLLQQNLPSGGVQPTIGNGAPQLTVDMNERFAVPDSVGVPDSI